MKTIGYYYDDCVVCEPCHEYFVDEASDAMRFGVNDAEGLMEWIYRAQPATFIGLPDGFTCVECANVITNKGDK